MRLLIVIALFSSAKLFGAEECNFLMSCDSETKVYLSNGTPLFFHDTLLFDDETMILLGQGTFKRKLKFMEGTPFSDFKLILEHPGGYSIFPLTKFKNGTAVKFTESIDTYDKVVQTSLPLSISLGEVMLLLKDKNGYGIKDNVLDGQYHTSYMPNQKSRYEYFEDFISSQLEFVLSEFGSNSPENDTNNMIPDLTLNCDVTETFETTGYTRRYFYNLDFSLNDGSTVLLTKSFPRNEFLKFNMAIISNRYWFISKVREFLNEVPLEDLQNKYSSKVAANQEAWTPITMAPGTNHNMQNTVVTVKGQYGHGSGVIVSKYGFILTNYHVIKNEKSITIITNEGNEIKGEVVRFNKQYDIALIHVKTKEFKDVAEMDGISGRNVGTPIYCVGSPLSEHLDGSVSEGHISGMYKKSDYEHYVVSANINPGNSGGGLFTKDGKLIGIVNAKIVGYSNHNIGFAIPVKLIKNELKINF